MNQLSVLITQLTRYVPQNIVKVKCHCMLCLNIKLKPELNQSIQKIGDNYLIRYGQRQAMQTKGK